MKNSKHPTRNLTVPLQFETLEPRLALAGNVLVEVKGGLDLVVTGDAAENDIAIALNGNSWRISGRNGTNISFDGQDNLAEAFVPLPDANNQLFRKTTINLKDAITNDPLRQIGGADIVELSGVEMTGDLKINGAKGGVVDLNGVKVRGKTTIDFHKANGLSSVTANEAIGSVITIVNSELGISPEVNGKTPPPKDVSILTKDCADVVGISNSNFGKKLTINTAGSRDCVGLVNVNVASNLAINAGSTEKGPASDFVGAEMLSVGGTTTVKTGPGDDYVSVGVLTGGASSLAKNVSVNTGLGNDAVAVTNVTFGAKVTALTKNGNDRVSIQGNLFTHPKGALAAVKSTNGGKDFDTLFNDLGVPAGVNGFESVSGDLDALLDEIAARAVDCLHDLFLNAGIGIRGTQFADSVIDFSSQFGDPEWAASQATGAPDTFEFGDIETAWAPSPFDGSQEFITLGFGTPVFASGVIIRETLGNGFVTQVDLLDENDVLHTVFAGTDPSQPGKPVNFLITFDRTDFLVKGVKIYVNTDHALDSWEEIDAVQLIGTTTA